jgi:hypothetical protein
MVDNSLKIEKFCKFTIQDCSDEQLLGLAAGDEIGFDLVESDDYFYVTITRKVCLLGANHPIYIICKPSQFGDLDTPAAMVEKFKVQFGDQLMIEG